MLHNQHSQISFRQRQHGSLDNLKILAGIMTMDPTDMSNTHQQGHKAQSQEFRTYERELDHKSGSNCCFHLLLEALTKGVLLITAGPWTCHFPLIFTASSEQ